MYMQQKDLTFYHFVSMNPLGFLKGSGINEILNGWIEEQIEGMGMDGRLYSRLISSIMKMTSTNLEQELRHMDIEPGEGRSEYFLMKLMLLTLWTGDYSTDDCLNFKKFVEEFLSKYEADQDGNKKNGRNSNAEPLRSKERYDEAFPALSFQTDGVNINRSLLTLNWANAVNSLSSLHEHPNLSLDHAGMKPITRFSCSNMSRGMYRVLKQTELKSTFQHHHKKTNARVGRARFHKNKRNTGSSNHRKKFSPCIYEEDEGRITDNEENYPYIEMVRRFQNWGLCEGVNEENPFPSLLFPMKDFTNDVNKKMKDENLLRVDEEGMKGIWMKMLNKTSGQSNISDVSIGDDNILSPSPKLSWTNHMDSAFFKTSEDAFHQESKLFNDLFFQKFYAYERILLDLLTQNDTYNFPWNVNYLDFESLTRPKEAGISDWNEGGKKESNFKDDHFFDEDIMTSYFEKEESKLFQPIKQEIEDFLSSNESIGNEKTSFCKGKEAILNKESENVFSESFQPRFSTPKYPKLNKAGEIYQGVNMLGVENFDTTSDKTSSQKRSKVRVNLEELFEPTSGDAGNCSGSESELGFKSSHCFEMFSFDDFENDADDECHSVSTIIFSDDDDCEELSSLFSSSLSSNCSNEKSQEVGDDWVKVNKFDLQMAETEHFSNLYSNSPKDWNVNTELANESIESNDNDHLPHFCKSLLRDSYYTVDTPQKDLNNNVCKSLPSEATTQMNLVPPSFFTVPKVNSDSACITQESPMNGWDRFIATPTSTRQLITFSQSKLNSLVKDTSTQPQSYFRQQFPIFDQPDDHHSPQNKETLARHNFTTLKSQSSLIPMFTVDLSTASSDPKLDLNNNIFQEVPTDNSHSTTSLPIQFLTLGNRSSSLIDHNPFKNTQIFSQVGNTSSLSFSFTCHTLPLDLISSLKDKATEDNIMMKKAESFETTLNKKDGVNVGGGIYGGECKEAGDSILEVVSDHLHKLRDDFEKGVILVGEELSEKENSKEKDSKDTYAWDIGGMTFDQIECQKDFAFEKTKLLFY